MTEKLKNKRWQKLLAMNQDKVYLIDLGKKGIQRLIFGRTLFVVVSIALQILLLVSAFTSLRNYLSLMIGGYYALVVVILLIIINRNMNPNMKVPWILISLLVPVVGGLLFLYVELSLGTRVVGHRVGEIINQAKEYNQDDQIVMDSLKNRDLAMYNLAGYLSKMGNNRIYQNTDVTYYDSGEAFLPELIQALQQAEHYIFLEYFIVKEGLMWGQILKVLKEKAAQGVDVRVMYDGFNTLTNLPVRYPRAIAELGISCKVFSPIRPVVSTIYNNRDHRKILVIDGKVGFTGGVNLADEYINEWELYGYWKDNAIKLEGDAVRGLTQMFLQMWNLTEPQPDFSEFLMPALPCTDSIGSSEKGYVQPYGDNPFDDELVGKNVYLSLINRAVHHIRFMTPYLILDHETKEALVFAAKRGVEVTLILPHIPDKKSAFALAKNHYKDLVEGGIAIYEFTPGFVHAKVADMDGEIATVGTINLDYRSLYHHFENGILLYHCPVIKEIEKDFEKTLSQCHRITWEDVKNENKLMRIAGYLLKAIAPLM